MKDKVVSVTELRTHCCALIAEVYEHGITVSVTKRGKPTGFVLRPLTKAELKAYAASKRKVDAV